MSRAAVLVLLLLMVAAIPSFAAQADATPPTVKAIRTTGAADRGVDGVVLTFSEVVDARRVDPSFFTLTGCQCRNARVEGTDVPATMFFIRFDAEMPTDLRPQLTYSQTSADPSSTTTQPIRDAAGNSLAPFTAAASDCVAPGVIDAWTQDLSGNGYIDAYRVNFTEPIDDDSVIRTQWAVHGTITETMASGPGYSTGFTEAVDDQRVYVRFEERAYLHSGALPQLTYSPSAPSGLHDLAACPDDAAMPTYKPNGLTTVSTSRVLERDGVQGRLLAFTAQQLGGTRAWALFSEPVVPAAGGSLQASHFVYTDTNAAGVGALGPVSASATTSVVTTTLPSAVRQADLDAPDRLAPGVGKLKDLSGNPILTTSVPLALDGQAPGTVSQVTMSAVGSTTAKVSWLSPADGDLATVHVRLKDQGTGNTPFMSMTPVAEVTAAPSAVQTYTLTGLLAERHYEVALRPRDLAGNDGAESHISFDTVAATAATGSSTSTTSASASGTTTASSPTVVGLEVVGGQLGSKSAVVEWRVPSGRSVPTSYEVRYATPTLANSTFATGLAVPAPAVGAAGSAMRVAFGGLAPLTDYTLGVRGIGKDGIPGAAAFVSFRTLEDATPPVGPLTLVSPTHTSGQPSSERDAKVSWAATPDGESAVTYRYALDQDAVRNVTQLDQPANGTSLELPDLADGTWYLHVAAFSVGGDLQAVPFQLVIDTTPPGPVTGLEASDVIPGSATLSWTAPAGDPSRLLLRQLASRTFEESEWANATEVPGVPVPAEDGTGQTFRVTGIVPGSELAFALRAIDAAGNLGEFTPAVAVAFPEDTTPPVGELVPSITGLRGGTVIGPDVRLSFAGADDPDAAFWFRYRVDQEADGDLGRDDPVASQPAATLTELWEGQWFLHARAESYGGVRASVTLPFDVVLLTPDELAAANAAVRLAVERDGDVNHLRWTLPADLPAPLGGIQVWASNSPYVLVSTLEADDPAFAAGALDHDGDAAKPSTRYLVTLFFGDQPETGFLDEETAPDAALQPGTAAPAEPFLSGNKRLVAMGLGAALGLAAIAGVVLLVVRRMRRARPPAPVGAAETADWRPADDGHPLADLHGPAAESRDVACYECSAVYPAVGALPLETVCPGCGARGMLGA